VKKHPLITAIVVFAVVFALIWIASHPAPKTPLLGERNGSTTRPRRFAGKSSSNGNVPTVWEAATLISACIPDLF
jgi:hypothetical protein